MKRFLSIVFPILLVLMLVVGCGKKTKKLDYIRFEFNHNQSAAEKIVIEQSKVGIVNIEEDSTAKSCDKKDGCSFTTYYNIKGLKKGSTKVTFIKK